MKTIKIYTIVFAMMFVSTVSIYAQKPANFSYVVTENLIHSLNHNVDGVVEASIYNTLFLSKYYPDANIKKVLNELNEIAISSINPVLRYKAQLAVLYITNYSNEELRLEDYKENQSDIFRMISSKLENSLLVSN